MLNGQGEQIPRTSRHLRIINMAVRKRGAGLHGTNNRTRRFTKTGAKSEDSQIKS